MAAAKLIAGGNAIGASMKNQDQRPVGVLMIDHRSGWRQTSGRPPKSDGTATPRKFGAVGPATLPSCPEPTSPLREVARGAKTITIAHSSPRSRNGACESVFLGASKAIGAELPKNCPFDVQVSAASTTAGLEETHLSKPLQSNTARQRKHQMRSAGSVVAPMFESAGLTFYSPEGIPGPPPLEQSEETA